MNNERKSTCPPDLRTQSTPPLTATERAELLEIMAHMDDNALGAFLELGQAYWDRRRALEAGDPLADRFDRRIAGLESECRDGQ